MKPKKSIDGLITRSAKKPAKPATNPKPKTGSSSVVPVKTTKPVTIKKTTKKPAVKVAVESLDEEPKDTAPTQSVEDFLSPVQAFDYDGESGELVKSKLSKKELKKQKKAEKKLKKSHKVRNIIASIILVIVLAFGGFVTWAVIWGNDIIAKITGGQGNITDIFKFMDDHYEPLKTDANGRTNILAIGTSGYDMSGNEGNGTHAGAQLTDSIMAISLNQTTGDIAMISFPRDLKAGRTCTATGKINELYWCNGGGVNASIEQEAAANQAVMNEVGGILGIEFQYYAHLNWGSLQSIVDTLGGITINLDEDILDYNWTGAVFEAGVDYQIDGAQAVGLARARHGTAGGDFSRGNSQQKILIGIKNKLMEKNLSIIDIMNLAGALGDNLRTNFSMDEIKTIAHLSQILDLDSMRQISLFDPSNRIYLMKTANINGISYVVPSAGVGNYTAIQNYVAPLLSNDARSYEQPKIAILNAKDEPGLAAAEKTKLENEGYTITAIDNIEGNFEYEYTLFYTSDRTPGTKNLIEKFYSIIPLTGNDIPENIPRDYDIVIVIGPSPSQEQASE